MNRALTLTLIATSGGVSLTACNLIANLSRFDNAAGDISDGGLLGSASSGETDMVDGGTPMLEGGDGQAPSGWCTRNSDSSTLFCQDFDESENPDAGWTRMYRTLSYSDFAAITSSTYAPDSPPGALLLSTPAVGPTGPSAQELFIESLGFPSVIDLKFALKIDNFDTSAKDVSLVRLSFGNNNGISFELSGSGASILETSGAGQTFVSHAMQQPALGVWVDVEWVVDLGASSGMMVSYNGATALSNTSIVSPPGSDGGVDVLLGLNFLTAPARPMEILYDNVLINLR